MHPGGLIHLRVMLRPSGSHTLVPVDLTVHAPRHGRELELFVGRAGQFRVRTKITSFAGLVSALNHQPKRSEVQATLFGRGVTSQTTASHPTGHSVQGVRVLRVLIVP